MLHSVFATRPICLAMTNVTIGMNRSRVLAPLRIAPALLMLGLGIWCCAIVAGFGLLLTYKHVQGTSGAAPRHWPENAQVSRSPERHTLLLFSHPHCPCTRATFRELERILAHSADQVDVVVIFVGLNGAACLAERTTLSSAAEQLGVVKILYDDGSLATLFRARTSGQVLVYSATGELEFAGGVTSSRGHEGQSIGGDAVLALLLGRANSTKSAAVFGCPLFSNAQECTEQSCKLSAARQ
jgi:hypothetical protein